MSRSVTLDSFLSRAEGLGSSSHAAQAVAHEKVDTRPVMDRLKVLESGEHDASLLNMTLPTLLAGEQYRFHFDMTRCIGCRCCEVACNEQNGNSAEVTWRRVGEIEGGSYPHVRRYHLSMACNHCLEPSCLEGCPTNAYEKLDNGIVKHNADSCIGCQYCTWNCPYGAPQFNPERRIVTKCHMCTDRMSAGSLPACVEACPVQAIQIEKVNVEEWRSAIGAANAPGVPPADLTLSTTRITLPADLPVDFGKANAQKLLPEPPHWSLVYFLTASQASVGAAVFALLLHGIGASDAAGVLSVMAALIGHAALTGTLFHLGRPLHALKAVRAFRRSWLSREVVAFSLYAGAAVVPALHTTSDWLVGFELVPTWMNVAGLWLSALSGLAGVYTSVRIYRIPARPAWDSARTTSAFFLTSALLGGMLSLVVFCFVAVDPRVAQLAALVVGAGTLASTLLPWALLSEGTSSEPALRSAALLLKQNFGRLLLSRTVLSVGLTLGLAFWTLAGSTAPAPELAILGLGLLGVVEAMGRYLFFRCVVPRNMPLNFFAGKPAH